MLRISFPALLFIIHEQMNDPVLNISSITEHLPIHTEYPIHNIYFLGQLYPVVMTGRHGGECTTASASDRECGEPSTSTSVPRLTMTKRSFVLALVSLGRPVSHRSASDVGHEATKLQIQQQQYQILFSLRWLSRSTLEFSDPATSHAYLIVLSQF